MFVIGPCTGNVSVLRRVKKNVLAVRARVLRKKLVGKEKLAFFQKLYVQIPKSNGFDFIVV